MHADRSPAEHALRAAPTDLADEHRDCAAYFFYERPGSDRRAQAL
ncbi:hypothetical protein [Streptomyces sp. NPDC023327]